MRIIDELLGLEDDMGRDEGAEPGPKAGEGAVVHHLSGESDFDGLPGDELPARKDPEKAKPFPQERAAD